MPVRKFRFAKLVRDKIVDQITASGNQPNWKVLSNDDFIDELKKKISEETRELLTANKDELVSELADIQEIIDNLLHALKINKTDVAKIQKQKNNRAGSFKKRQYIDHVTTKNNSSWVKYYLANPDKYPEMKP